MKNRAFIIVLFIPMIVFLIGCEDCHEISEKLLTDIQKSQIPFDENEKITFTDGQQIIEFIVSEVSDTLYREYPSSVYCDWYNVENYTIVLNGVNHYIIFHLIARNEFYIILKSEYKYQSFMHIDQHTAELSDYDEFLDSITINNSLYYNIYKVSLVDITYPDDIPDSLNHPIRLYYSTDYGIVKVDFSDGSTWELEEIEW